MASSSRKRETTSASTGGDAHFLSDVIRTADIDCLNIEKRTKFIKAQLDNMSDDQLTRFEFFVRSHLSRGKVKEILTASVPSKYTITDDMAIVVGSLAKLFVGELVETSMDVLGERQEHAKAVSSNPDLSIPSDDVTSGGAGLQAQYLREGFRRMQCEGKIGLSSRAFFPFSRKRMLQSVDDSDSILMSGSPLSSSQLHTNYAPFEDEDEDGKTETEVGKGNSSVKSLKEAQEKEKACNDTKEIESSGEKESDSEMRENISKNNGNEKIP